MKGSIRKRTGPQGTAYLVRVEYPPDPLTGKRRQRSKTFPTRKRAEAELARWLTEVYQGTALEPSKTTVALLLDRWLSDVAAHNVKPSTLEDYAATIRTHVVPALGGVIAQKLTVDQVQAFYTAKLRDGASPRTVQLCHLRLSQALRQGVRWNLLPRNVCDFAKPPRVEYQRGDVWSVDEGRTFLETADRDGLHPFWLLALKTGMRRGELLGLRWRDLDLDRGMAHVRQSVIVFDGKPCIQTPKTAAAQRAVKLSPDVVAALRTHRKAWLARRVAAAEWRDSDLIFCTRTGGPVNPNNIARAYEALVKRAGVRRIRFHDLRHTHATWLLQSGQPVKVVSERLGHAKVSITLDTYAAVLPAMQDRVVEALDALMAREQAS